MGIIETTKRVVKRSNRAQRRLDQLLSGLDGLSQLINQRLNETVQGLDNQSRLLNQRLSEINGISQLDNQRLNETVQGLDNQSQLLNQRLSEIVEALNNQSQVIATRLDKVIDGIKNQSDLFNRKLDKLILGLENHSHGLDEKLATQNDILGGQLEILRGLHGIQPYGERLITPEAGTSFSQKSLVHPSRRPGINTNDLAAFHNVFDDITPWRGRVPHRFIADFLGQLTDIDFHPMLFTDPKFDGDSVGAAFEETTVSRLADVKTPADAEAWFETVDWVISAREARDRYVMVTLGANYGAQAVGAYRALQAVNPLPYKLVAVEPVPENLEWIKRHMRNNGIDPEQQWIVPLAISDRVDPVFFPVGGPGIGANNCYSTNEEAARAQYAEDFISRGLEAEALRNLLTSNTTGIKKDLVAGHDFPAEIKLVSSITLHELLSPFETVDLLEADIQQSEILVFPPFVELLRRKVRRIHIGTHGEDVHTALHNLFADNGWEIVFSFKPNAQHESALGNFETNDGVLTVRNPYL